MAVDASLSGRTFPPTPPYVVSAERIAEFARATGSTYDGGAAPATFPIVAAGDELTATLTVDSLRQLGGADIIGTRSEIADADGLPVCTAFATLVHRGEDR
jgi:acyl dehydratase